jgi:hypothetical protein
MIPTPTAKRHDLRVADSNMHVLQPPDVWERSMDPRFRHSGPKGMHEQSRDIAIRTASSSPSTVVHTRLLVSFGTTGLVLPAFPQLGAAIDFAQSSDSDESMARTAPALRRTSGLP